MHQTTLQFPSIIEMIDFQTIVGISIIYYNRTDLTLTGEFTEAEIELAKTAYGAVVISG